MITVAYSSLPMLTRIKQLAFFIKAIGGVVTFS